MSRGLIILICLLSVVLAALLFIGKSRQTVDLATVPVTNAASEPVTRPPLNARPPVVTTSRPQPATNAQLLPRTNTAAHVVAVKPSGAPGIEAPKTLPEMERAYLSTTNRDTRLDLMMDVSENPTADAVKTLTRLFEAETDPELKVDLIDSLLGVDGFKDEKLIMLTLGIRQGLPRDVRESAIDGLIDLDDSRGISLLNALLNDPDPELRQSAQDAIELLQTPAQPIPKLR